jgi:hypothetical protein
MTLGSATGAGAQENELSRALCGMDADRERAVALQTRRVVMASLGVLKELKAGHRRTRAVAIAATVLVFLVVGPPVWWMAETLIEDERLTSTMSEMAVWGFLVCAALLGSALLAGWVRRKS